MTSFVQYFASNLEKIGVLFYNHVQYTLFAILIAILIGVPLGIVIYNSKQLNKPVLSLANIVQAIPSLAILGFIVPYFGIGASTAIFMVVLYSLLPILKNTYAGLSSINKDTLEAARGIGLTNAQVLYKVQLPLALPVIMAGIRISSVTAVGLMTIAAYIGADVLGTLVISGIQTLNSNLILSGAIPACVLALSMDFLMSKVERAVTPVSLQLTTSNLTSERIEAIKRSKKTTAFGVSSVFAVIAIVLVISSFNQAADIVVGSKEATEGKIVGYIISQTLEAKTDLRIEERMGLGGTSIAYAALQTGEIDIYPEYTGTLFSSTFSQSFEPGTPSDEVFLIIKDLLYTQDKLHALTPFDVNNTYVLAVRRETAEKYDLQTISDLKSVASNLLMGGEPEFNVREDGLIGLQKAYGIEFKDALQFSGALMYSAIDSGEVDIISAFSTDSMIAKYDLITLEDDLSFFPPYELLPVTNQKVYVDYPEVIDILEEISSLLTDDVMRELNGKVTDDAMEPKDVAIEFLKEQGIIG